MAISDYAANTPVAVICLLIMSFLVICAFSIAGHSYYSIFIRKRQEKKLVRLPLKVLTLLNITLYPISILALMIMFFVTSDYPLGVGSAFAGIVRVIMLLIFIQRLKHTFESTAFTISRIAQNVLYTFVGVLIFLQLVIDISETANNLQLATFSALLFLWLENITAITVLVLFAKRLFYLMKLCASQNTDLEFKSSMISHDADTIDTQNTATESQMNTQISVAGASADNLHESIDISNTNNLNINVNNDAIGVNTNSELSNNNNTEKLTASTKKAPKFNEDQIEYLHLITRLTVINAVTMISGQLVYLVYLALYSQYGLTKHIVFYVALHNMIDLFVDLCCVYFACTFSSNYYRNVCCCCHYVVYQICLFFAQTKNKAKSRIESTTLTVQQ